MDFKEYLLDQSAIGIGYIAEKMWPNNKRAKSYLSSKLNGKLNWTATDNKKAKKAINESGTALRRL